MNATEPLTLTAADFDPAIHNGEVTLTSPRTGDHRTFRIKTVKNDQSSLVGKRILYLFTGSDNEDPSAWQGFAFVDDQGRCLVWKRFKADGRPSLYQSFAHMIECPTHWAARGVTYQISGHCRRCNRLLTHPESIATGMGPECSGRGHTAHR